MKKMVMVLSAFCISIGVVFRLDASQPPAHDHPSLLIIDTDGHDQYSYRNLMLMAQSAGFQVEYRNFYTFLENGQIWQYDAVFFITSVGMFKNLQSPLIQKCIKIMQDYARLENKTIGIFLPGLPNFSRTIYQLTLALIGQLGLSDRCNENIHTIQFQSYWQELIKAILKPDTFTGHLYGTTLINQQLNQQTKKPLSACKPYMIGDHIAAAAMPIDQHFCAQALATLPAGAYARNFKTGNQYFISKISEFTFADMPENFLKILST